MIASVVEAVYDDYAKVNFTNYDSGARSQSARGLCGSSEDVRVPGAAGWLLISIWTRRLPPNQGGDGGGQSFKSVHQAEGDWGSILSSWSG